MRSAALVLIAVLLAAPVAATPAAAGDTAATPRATVRLLDGGADGASRLAGVEIVLEPQWKTYWRVPGDTGVPPEFDWSASSNVSDVRVGWPAPARLRDAEGGDVIGYETAVVFPVTVTAADANAAVDLKLTLHFAVCHDICLPAEASVERRLDPGSPGADRAAISAALATVPSDAPGDAVTVAGVTLDAAAGQTALVVDLAGPAVSDATDILVEGPATAYFGPPAAEPSATGGHRFRLPVSVTGDAAALVGREVTLTILAGETRLVRKAAIR